MARSLAAPKAFIVIVLAGFLLLPEGNTVDLPLLPGLDKISIPVLCALVFVVIFGLAKSTTQTAPLMPRHLMLRFSIVALVFGAFMMVMTNGDGIVIANARFLRRLQPYDAFSEILTTLILLLPLLLARKYLGHPSMQILLLKTVVIAATCYTFLALYEIRMSPQLNITFYGFFPHAWVQHFRGGSWRPLVFLSHGLVLALFFAMAATAALGLAKILKKQRAAYMLATGWIFGTLLLSSSLGALIIAVLLLPMVMFLGVRTQLIAASVIAGLVIFYPALRSSQIMPIETISQAAASIDEARARSLMVRLRNEEAMLTKASQRPVFGWGGWGRSRVYDQNTGRDYTLADGYWIITLGVGGWWRYIFEFGLFAFPIFLLTLRAKRFEIGPETSVIALMLAGNMIDLIPNSGVTPLTWMLAGALWGRLELGRVTGNADPVASASQSTLGYRRTSQADATQPASAPAYTRQSERHERQKRLRPK
ncbi:hypothetical protein [Algirhabdus cladophorae]|uniref:hypothetical protein n=1 Tax=Algirhabdus cladophorae TaxID=3377108 RepID=UPI003B8498DB